MKSETDLNQVTVTEYNDSEGETFGYILHLSKEHVDFLWDIIATTQDEDDPNYVIEETDYSLEDVNLVNSHSDNSYQARLGYYKIEDEMLAKIDNWKDGQDKQKLIELIDDIFYKGRGLDRDDEHEASDDE